MAEVERIEIGPLVKGRERDAVIALCPSSEVAPSDPEVWSELV